MPRATSADACGPCGPCGTAIRAANISRRSGFMNRRFPADYHGSTDPFPWRPGSVRPGRVSFLSRSRCTSRGTYLESPNLTRYIRLQTIYLGGGTMRNRVALILGAFLAFGISAAAFGQGFQGGL